MCHLPTQIPSTNAVSEKSDLHVFYPKNLFFNLFKPQTPYKYTYNTRKLTFQPIKLKKRSKPLNHTEKKYFTLDLDLFFFSLPHWDLKQSLYDFSHLVELVYTNSNIFSGQNCHQQRAFSLFVRTQQLLSFIL